MPDVRQPCRDARLADQAADADTATSLSGGAVTVPGIAPFAGAFSIEAWVKAGSGSNADKGIVGKWRSGGEASPGGVMLYLDGSGFYRVAAGTNTNSYLTTSVAPAPGVWEHVVVSYDGSYLRLYRDGGLLKTKAYAAGLGAPTVDFEVGRYAGLAAKAFAGEIDEVAVYPGALSQRRIFEHYLAGRALVEASSYQELTLAELPEGYWRLGEPSGAAAGDESVYARDGAYQGAVSLGEAGALPADPDQAAGFDGSSGYVSAPGVPAFAGAFTIAAWVKATAAVQADRGLAGRWRSSGQASPGGAMLTLVSGSGTYALAVGPSTTAWLQTNVTPALGEWEYLAGSYDGATLRLYLNGVEIASKPFTGSLGAPQTPFEIGRYAGQAIRSFQGMLDEVAIYNRALPPAVIRDQYLKRRELTRTRYLHGGTLETDTAGTITLTATAGPAGDLARYTGPPTTSAPVSYLYYTGHGDLAAEADTTGSRTAAYTYDPFGAPLQSTPTNQTAERWTGRHDKQLDTTSGLIEMGARPYDPVLGRFLAVDPIDGGSANNYDYAGQDPVNNYDLTGTLTVPCRGHSRSYECAQGSPTPALLVLVGAFAGPEAIVGARAVWLSRPVMNAREVVGARVAVAKVADEAAHGLSKTSRVVNVVSHVLYPEMKLAARTAAKRYGPALGGRAKAAAEIGLRQLGGR